MDLNFPAAAHVILIKTSYQQLHLLYHKTGKYKQRRIPPWYCWLSGDLAKMFPYFFTMTQVSNSQ